MAEHLGRPPRWRPPPMTPSPASSLCSTRRLWRPLSSPSPSTSRAGVEGFVALDGKTARASRDPEHTRNAPAQRLGLGQRPDLGPDAGRGQGKRDRGPATAHRRARASPLRGDHRRHGLPAGRGAGVGRRRRGLHPTGQGQPSHAARGSGAGVREHDAPQQRTGGLGARDVRRGGQGSRAPRDPARLGEQPYQGESAAWSAGRRWPRSCGSSRRWRSFRRGR